MFSGVLAAAPVVVVGVVVVAVVVVVVVVLQLLTFVSLSVWATRLVLGYLRMDDRYKSIVAQLLAGETHTHTLAHTCTH